jgi:hypothetical protein
MNEWEIDALFWIVGLLSALGAVVLALNYFL